jgi:hypothetical protein
MDPLTILAVAKGSYEAIKAGVKIGKEIQGMFTDVSKLWGSCAKLAHMAADPPKPKLFERNGKSAEEIAIDAFNAKQQAIKYSEEVKNLILAEYGMYAWDEIQKEIIHIRKEQKAAILKAKLEAEQLKKDIAMIMLICLVAIVIMSSLFGLILIL